MDLGKADAGLAQEPAVPSLTGNAEAEGKKNHQPGQEHQSVDPIQYCSCTCKKEEYVS